MVVGGVPAVGGGFGQSPLQFGVAGIGDNPLAIGTGAGGAGDIGSGGSGGGIIGLPNLGSSGVGTGLPGGLSGLVPGLLTPPTATGAGPLGGITGLTQAKIVNVVSPPFTAIGTSFPIEVDFVNNGPVPGQFRLILTFAQLGIDQVGTPPQVVQPGQIGSIRQQMQFPVIHPPPGPYVGSAQLVHTDSTGAAIVDDAADITLPPPSGAALTPGEGIISPTGQLVPPSNVGLLPGVAAEVPGIVPSPLGPIPAVGPVPISPPTPFFRPGPGIGCGSVTQNAVIIGNNFGTGQPIAISGYNFCPLEPVIVHHRIVLHGFPQIEGHVIDLDDATVADNSGRINLHVPMPRLPVGARGDGTFQATGRTSNKSASTSVGVN